MKKHFMISCLFFAHFNIVTYWILIITEIITAQIDSFQLLTSVSIIQFDYRDVACCLYLYRAAN